MGTLLKQPPRLRLDVSAEDVEHFLDDVKRISKVKDMPVAEVLTAFQIKELQRQNTLSVNNSDVFDEQMMGIGERLDTLNAQLRQLAWSVSNNELEGFSVADALFALAEAMHESKKF